MEALRKEMKNRRNKEKQRHEGEGEPGFPLAIETAKERRGKRDEEDEIVGVPKMAPRDEGGCRR